MSVVRREWSIAMDASETPLQIRRSTPPQTDVDIASKFGEVWTMTILGPS